MEDKRLKVGIAGYGVVGNKRRYCIDLNLHLKTVAVSDIKFGGEGFLADGTKYVSSYQRLLEEDLDVLFVSLPNYLAAEATIAGLEKGVHVFCEKPPGRTVEDIKYVIEAEKKNPTIKLKYGFNHRYHYSVIEAKKTIDERTYGDVINLRGVYGKSSIISYESGWRSERKWAGGGILLDQGIHLLDMIRYFTGDYDEIKSFVSNHYWHHDVEDNAYVIMRNREGCVATIHSTATQWQHRFRLEITLREALIELTGILSGSKSYGEERLKIIPRIEGSHVGSSTEINSCFLEDDSWKAEVDDFADIILSDKNVTNGNSHDALKIMEMVYAIYCADQKWKDTFHISG